MSFVEQTKRFRRRLGRLKRKDTSFELHEKMVWEAEHIEAQEDEREWSEGAYRRPLWLQVVTLHRRERLLNASQTENLTCKSKVFAKIHLGLALGPLVA